MTLDADVVRGRCNEIEQGRTFSGAAPACSDDALGIDGTLRQFLYDDPAAVGIEKGHPGRSTRRHRSGPMAVCPFSGRA